jgi:protein involved in polysaccharide export with SLBB domain
MLPMYRLRLAIMMGLLLCLGLMAPVFALENDPIDPPLPDTATPSAKTVTDLNSVFQLRANRSHVARKYLLGPYDALSMSVFESPEYDQRELVVQPDGKLTIAPIGSVDVTGLTVEELHDQLVEKFRFYLNNPQITLKLERTKSLVIPVTGAVLRPGSIEMVPGGGGPNAMLPLNTEVAIQRRSPILSNVLLSAGGISYDADLEHITIKNDLDGTELQVNMLKYLKDGDASQDVYLVSGDAVHVPRLASPLALDTEKYRVFQRASFAPRTVPVKVVGYVREPGLIQLNSDQSTNLNSAIVSAGGYLQDSAYMPPKVRISRQTEQGTLVEWWVDPRKNDTLLMPNDMVYVPQKALPRAGLFFDYMARIVAPFNGVASTYNNWALMFDPTRYSAIRNNPQR